jgi:ribonuclease P protein component
MPTLIRLDDREGERTDEADFSAEPPPEGQDPRVPRANEDAGRAQGAQAATGEGAQTAGGLTGRFTRRERLTSAAQFQALFQQGRRVERPSLIVLWRPADTATKVGFAVSRQVRGAVDRNRVKRRLRAAYRATRSGAPANIAMVVVGRPGARTVQHKTLIREMGEAFESIPGPRPAA